MKATVGQFVAFIMFWGVVVALAIASHDHVPRAQAFVRVSTVPLGIVALMTVLDRLPLERLTLKQFAIPAVLSLPAIQVLYVLGQAPLVAVALAVTAGVAMFRRDEDVDIRHRRIAIVVLLVLLSSEFPFYYVNYPVQRLGMIPASAILLVIRTLAAALLSTASAAAAILLRRVARRLDADNRAALSLALIACVQLAYFYIDSFANPGLRFVHAATVLVAAVGVAAHSTAESANPLRLGPLTAISIFVLLVLQFAYSTPITSRDWSRTEPAPPNPAYAWGSRQSVERPIYDAGGDARRDNCRRACDAKPAIERAISGL